MIYLFVHGDSLTSLRFTTRTEQLTKCCEPLQKLRVRLGKIAAHSAYDMLSWYKYLIVNLVFSHLGFWSGNLFLIAPFPDRCLLVPLKITTERGIVAAFSNKY